MNVLVVMNSFRRAGSEGDAVRHIRQLHRRGVTVAVACLQRHGALLGDLLPLGIDPAEFPFSGFFGAGYARQVACLAAHVRRLRAQVVHAYDFYTNLLAVPAARLAGVRAVVASRREIGDLKTRAQLAVQRVAYRLAARVLVNSQHLARILIEREHVPAWKVAVCLNCVDVPAFDVAPDESAGVPAQGEIVVMVANLHPYKDHETLLAAARLVLGDVPHARFLLIGDGPSRDRLETTARSLGVEQRVEFTGPRSDVPRLLARSAVGVLTSLSEGSPNAVLEYMAAGKPVVATAVGGTRELVQDGETGYLVPVRDAGALADRLRYLLQNPWDAKRMGAEGRRRIEAHFSAEVSSARIVDLYRDLIDLPGPRAGI